MAASSEVESRVLRCLCRATARETMDGAVSPDTHLFEDAIVDSLAAVALISELEAEFGIKLGDDDLFGPEFTTLRGISRLVEARSVRGVA